MGHRWGFKLVKMGLLNKCTKIVDKFLKGQEYYIIYTSNKEGRLEHHWVPHGVQNDENRYTYFFGVLA